MKKFLIATYIIIHMCVALMGIRIWPLTDYPMFGWSYPKKEKIHSYYWAYQTRSGEKIKITEPDYGRGDLRTFTHAFNGVNEKLEIIASRHVKKAPENTSSLILIDRFVQRHTDDSFEIKEEVIFKRSLQ